jgi:hypothetical protein
MIKLYSLSCCTAIFVTCCCFAVHAQNILTDFDRDQQHRYDRMTILTGGGPAELHSSILPLWRHDVVALADRFSLLATDDRATYDVQQIWDQNNEFVIAQPVWVDSLTVKQLARYRTSERPLWNTFYKTPAHFFEVDVPDFYLRINPILHIAAGRESTEAVTPFINQRGISIRGGIGKNVYFQTSVFESQVRFANYVNVFTDSFGVVPGAGLFKPFESAFFDVTAGRDYLLANAYVGVNLGKYIGFQLGHNQCFIGDGIRSLLFSDFSTPFFSLKLNTRIWKFHYQNIFAELAADNFMSVSGNSEPIPKKYLAAHYLSFKLNSAITLSLFEAVVFNRDDHQFELQYLNPIIFYRTVEGSLGSPDNVLLGLNARVDLYNRISLYGQLVLDDLSVRNILEGHMDWWGNKFGHQLGVKYVNALNVDHLDLQAEWNTVRPYTYSHYDADANYSNYKQPLAHPLGANFNEIILSAHYAASPRLRGTTSLYLMRIGEDVDSISFGGNIIVPNTQRQGDFGNAVAQGVGADILFWSTRISYEMTPGLLVEGRYVFRKKKSDVATRDLQTNLFQLGVRYNIATREDVF